MQTYSEFVNARRNAFLASNPEPVAETYSQEVRLLINLAEESSTA
jgi:hypothetical protein